MAKRVKTNYPGVYYREARRVGGKGLEKVYYIVFKKDGKAIEEKAGRQYADDMTPARAAGIRAERIEGKRLSRKEIKDQQKKKKELHTIDQLWEKYKATRSENTSLSTDVSRYKKYLKPHFGNKKPQDILLTDIDKLKAKWLKIRSPQTVKHILNLLTWIVNFGIKRNLCPGLAFHIQKPTVNNLKTEDLSPEELENLLNSIEKDENINAKNLMKLALFTGMRRGELLNTMWQDIDFTKKIIHICPKDDTEFTWKRQIKNTDRRDAPITKELAESLSGYRAQQPAGYPYVFVPPKRYCRIQKARRP